jgi:prepilin-type N-terminal cleavage/methylation domain-containing protein
MFKRLSKAFTLIELLIVVAIIAILAAIAVPNFLEAQVRSKVSRAKADLRSIATGLESYRVDNNGYPPTPFVSLSFDGGVLRVLPNFISTPIAYLTTASMEDPFIMANLGDFQGIRRDGVIDTYGPDPAYPNEPGGDPRAGRRYYYQSNRDARRSGSGPGGWQEGAREVEGEWVTASLGPNKQRDLVDMGTFLVLMPYDATNGTISDGDVVRTQKESDGTLAP